MGHAMEYFRSSLGKKVLMAVTGFIFFGFVVGHMAGNLQIYLGAEKINHYSELLHSMPSLLWAVRLVLITSVALHVVLAWQLWMRNRAGRPIEYRVYTPPSVDYAAKTMIFSGPVLACFVVLHLLHLTTGTLHHDYSHDVYRNLVVGFSNPYVSVFYILANLFLAMHLYHGLWSFLQTLGLAHPRLSPWRRRFAVAFAALVGLGNISIPLSVLAGVVHL